MSDFSITRLMNNQIKKPKKSKFPRRRDSDNKNAVAFAKSVSQLGCVSQDSDALVSLGRKSRRKLDAESLGSNSKGTINQVYARSCEYPGKERTIVEKTSVKVLHRRSPNAIKFEDRSPECKNKTSQETQRSLQKFLEPERKPKVIYTDNSLEFGKARDDLSWNHCTSTTHRSENGIAERAVRRAKGRHFCCIVAIRSE